MCGVFNNIIGCDMHLVFLILICCFPSLLWIAVLDSSLYGPTRHPHATDVHSTVLACLGPTVSRRNHLLSTQLVDLKWGWRWVGWGGVGDDALAGDDSINISPACTCSGHRWIFVHRLSHALSQNMLKWEWL